MKPVNARTSKNRNMNVKFPDRDYKDLQNISDDIGLSLSAMVRLLIYTQLDKVRKSGVAKDFLKSDD